MNPNDIETKEIKQITFSLLSSEEIHKLSVCEVNDLDLYEKDGKTFKKNSLFDMRMGPIGDKRKNICLTCHGDYNSCPGHLGHIDLVFPMFNPLFDKEILKILREVCLDCSKVRKCQKCVEKPNSRFCKCKGGCCINCGAAFPNKIKYQKYKIYENKHIIEVITSSANASNENHYVKIYAKRVLEIFKKLSDDVIETHFNYSKTHCRPEWMIFTKFPVLPPILRPLIKYSTKYQQDSINYFYRNIIRYNNKLKRKVHSATELYSPHVSIQAEVLYMQNEIDMLFTKAPTLKDMKKRKNFNLGFGVRLYGKWGHFRGLNGKRVDFSGRNVITPDPTLNFNELGIHVSIAMNLTIPLRVNKYNLNYSIKLIKNGPFEYPGANYVIDSNERRYSLMKYDITELKMGFIVERHLIDGDYLLLNRQPSLRKQSMMCHKIKVHHGDNCKSFRISTYTCTPYNADFDGDEMNIHVPQSEYTRAEAQELLAADKNIISVQKNFSLFSPIQDILLGATLLTFKDAFLTKKQFFNLLTEIQDLQIKIPIPAIIRPVPLWTGKQVFSLLLSNTYLHYRKRANGFSSVYSKEDMEKLDERLFLDVAVIISNGQLICGCLTKNCLGPVSNSITRVLYDLFSSNGDVIELFFANLQRVVCRYLLMTSYSIGISDCTITQQTFEQIEEIKKKRINELNEAVRGEIKGGFNVEKLENDSNQRLNSIMGESGVRLLNKVSTIKNSIKFMTTSGSKGNKLNLCQIMGCVGQQNLLGKRIPFMFRSNRTLPHFSQHDFGPQSKGFVENSYIRGLTPTEFFFHMIGGREGIVDTACKTSESGYIQRRLAKFLEDIKVEYDGTVRNKGKIVQFVYGGDGIDVTKCSLNYLKTSCLTNFSELYEYKGWGTFNDDDESYYVDPLVFGKGFLPQLEIKLFTKFPQSCIWIKDELVELKQIVNELNSFGVNEIALPFNMDTILLKYYGLFHGESSCKRKLIIDEQIEEVIKCVNEFCNKFSKLLCKNGEKEEEHFIVKYIKLTFASKRCFKEHKFGIDELQLVLGEIEEKIQDSFVEPGEMVGAEAAGAISEPATQLTLNTFHYAGVSSKNVTLGIPRLNELLNCYSKLKNHYVQVYVLPSITHEKAIDCLEEIKLKDVCQEQCIYYDPIPNNDFKSFKTIVKEDEKEVYEHYQLIDKGDYDYIDLNESDLSSWVIKLKLNPTKFTGEISLNSICDEFEKIFDPKTDIIIIPLLHQNAIRLRFKIDLKCKEDDDDLSYDYIENEIIPTFLEMRLSGLKNCHSITVDKQKTLNVEIKNSRKRPIKQDFEQITKKRTLPPPLYRILGQHEFVDSTKTISNSLNEIYTIFGVEAARAFLFREIKKLIEFDGNYINWKHLMLLVDEMSHFGIISPVTRHGAQRNNDPLKWLTFEQAIKELKRAVFVGQTDDLESMSSKTAIGGLIKGGSGEMFDLFLDPGMLIDVLRDSFDFFGEERSVGGIGGGGGFGEAGIGKESFNSENYPISTPYMKNSPYYSSLFDDVDFVHNGNDKVPKEGVEGTFSPIRDVLSNRVPQSPFWNGKLNSSTDTFTKNPYKTYYPSSPELRNEMLSYSPTSPSYSPTSPKLYSPTSPKYSPTSPKYSPTSPKLYSPTSPVMSPHRVKSKSYSPTSPRYVPTPPRNDSVQYSPTSINIKDSNVTINNFFFSKRGGGGRGSGDCGGGEDNNKFPKFY